MLVRNAFEDYQYAIKRLAEKTQREYTSKLSFFVQWCENEGVTLECLNRKVLRRFFDYLATAHCNPRTNKPISSSTQHGYARTIKAFLCWASREEDFEDIMPESIPRKMEMPRVETKVIEILTTAQIEHLTKVSDREYNQELRARDKAIIAVLAGTGIRASELVGLTLEQCYITPKDSYIRVFGKGQKWREVPLDDDTTLALRRYINRCRHASEGETHVFLNRYRQQLTVDGLDQTISRLGEWAGIKGVRCSPHTFRHGYAVRELLKGLDIYRLKLRMGHSSVKVTEGYLRAVEAIIARKAENLYIDTAKAKRR